MRAPRCTAPVSRENHFPAISGGPVPPRFFRSHHMRSLERFLSFQRRQRKRPIGERVNDFAKGLLQESKRDEGKTALTLGPKFKLNMHDGRSAYEMRERFSRGPIESIRYHDQPQALKDHSLADSIVASPLILPPPAPPPFPRFRRRETSPRVSLPESFYLGASNGFWTSQLRRQLKNSSVLHQESSVITMYAPAWITSG